MPATPPESELPDGPFRGVPFLIKDLFAGYAGQPISNGNVAFKNAKVISDADTTLVSRFRGAGLVIAGRTNSPELGSVPTTEPVPGARRTTRGTSPHARRIQRRRSRGRRRGMVPFAHASDGGGSIRIPAVVLRAGRAEAQPGPDLARPDPRREPRCPSNFASAARCATRRRCLTRCADPASATR